MDDGSPTISRAAHRPPHPALWTGLYTGALLTIVMMASLVAANRAPGLERYALERNAASYGLFVILMLIPVCRFLTRPLLLFASAMVGWVVFVVSYDVAGLFFSSLFEVLRTPFELLVEGTIVYGVFAVATWVFEMVVHARHHAVISRRRAHREVHHHS